MAERAGVVSVDVTPDVSGFTSKWEAFAAHGLKPLGIKLDARFDELQRDLSRGTADAQRSLDRVNTSKAQGELRLLGTTGEKELGRVSKSAGISGKALLGIGAGTAVAGAKIISSLRPVVDAASDLNEAASFSKVVFGDNADAIDRFASTAADKLGQSKRSALDASATFASLGKAAGLSGDDLVDFSTALVKLSTDFASAKNTSPEEAVTAIGAALRGETEPIRQYGVLLDDATLRQEAFNLKLTETTKNVLTPQQKVLAANSLIFKNSTDLQGDFARTADQGANAQRRFNAAAEDTKAKAGQGLLGLFTAVTNAGNKFLNILNEIPGATTALGVGVFGLGSAALIGGTTTSIIGGVRAFKEWRAGAALAAEEAAKLAAATEAAAAATTELGVTGTRTFGPFAEEATVAATATGAVATGMGAVAAEAPLAGAAGTAAMTGIAGSAGTAAIAVGLVGKELATLNTAGLANIGTGLAGLGAAGIGRGAFIDLEGVEESVVATRELGPAVVTAETAIVASGGRMSGALSKVGTSLGGAAAGVRGFVGGLPPMLVGIGAAIVAFEGFKFAIDENNKGFQEALDIIDTDAREILASLDPAKPKAFVGEAAKVATALAGLNDIGPLSAADKIKDFFGLFDAGDERDNEIEVRREQLKELGSALDQLPVNKARATLDQVTAALIALGTPAEEADRILADLYDRLSERVAIDRVVGNFEEAADALDRFGFKVDETKSKWERYVDSLSNIFDPIQNAISAQAALESGQERLVEARKKLADIEAGNSDALVDSRKALIEAQHALTKAIEDDAERQKDAAEKLEDAQDRLADALAKGRATATGGDKVIGFGEKDLGPARDIEDAQRGVEQAQRDLEEARRSEGVADAKDRVADAQKRVNDELAKTGPNSEAARQAQQEINDLERDMPGLVLAVEQANARLREELDEHPGAIQAAIDKVNEWQRQGLISIAVAEAWKKALWDVAAAAAAVKPGVGVEGQTTTPGFVPSGVGDRSLPVPQQTTTRVKRDPKKDQLAGAQFPPNPLVGDVVIAFGPSAGWPDRPDSVYRWNGKNWVVAFAEGGFSGDFPSMPDMVPTLGAGKFKVTQAFEAKAGKWEAYIPEAPAVRPRAVKVLGRTADAFGYELAPKRKYQIGSGADFRAFAGGGFGGRREPEYWMERNAELPGGWEVLGGAGGPGFASAPAGSIPLRSDPSGGFTVAGNTGRWNYVNDDWNAHRPGAAGDAMATASGAAVATTSGAAEGPQLLTEETGRRILTALVAGLAGRPNLNIASGAININEATPQITADMILREAENATYGRG